ncbi:MAG: YqeG family HAD IIIA-type phosphatase [Armatimonadota bacterium]
MGLCRWLRPDLIVRAMEDVDLDALAARGIRGILLDVDNTLTRWQSTEVGEEKRRWVEAAKARFSLCLLSNTFFSGRLRDLGETLGVPYIGCWGLNRKPLRGGFMAALGKIGADASEACMIGDQIFADVLGAKRSGLMAILVDPVDPATEFLGTRLMRLIERPMRRKWSTREEC